MCNTSISTSLFKGDVFSGAIPGVLKVSASTLVSGFNVADRKLSRAWPDLQSFLQSKQLDSCLSFAYLILKVDRVF